MNYYEILGVSREATNIEIAKAFRVLAKEYHPDINKSPDAKIKFINIYEAYSILKDNEKRSIYDKISFANNEIKKETTDDSTYTKWQETAKDEGKYYSETNYNDFAEKVLKNIKVVAKTTSVIIGFFVAMIVLGLISKFIISPIRATQLEKAIIEYYNTIPPEDTTKQKIDLPLPLPLPLEDWKRIYIEGVGTIDIPPTMEVQSGLYKEIIDPLRPEIMREMGFASNSNYDIIIQQKGLNELTEIGYQRYARVMIDTDIGNVGDFDTLTFDIEEYSVSDIIELNNIVRSSMVTGMAGTGLKIVNWLPLKFETINGMSCIHISYVRQLNNNPTVFVSLYRFQNVDRMYTLTLSYRQNEEEYWKDDFEILLNSFRIENIK